MKVIVEDLSSNITLEIPNFDIKLIDIGHSVSIKYMDKASRLYDILKDMGFKHGYRKINGKVAEVLIDTEENKFYKL